MTASFSLSESVGYLEVLSEKEQQKIRWLLCDDLYNGINEGLVDFSECPGFKACPLLSFGPVPGAWYFGQLKKSELAAVFKRWMGCDLSMKLKKSEMLEHVIASGVSTSDVAPQLAMASFVRPFDRAKRKVYSYLLRKFEDDCFMDELGVPWAVPHGSVCNGDLYYFPDDEITDLLNQYGSNRCAAGFSPLLVVFGEAAE